MKQLRVVLLHDSQSMHRLYDVVLHHYYPDARVICCFHGDEALVELRREPPDLLITDLQHPGAGLAELTANAKVPVIVISHPGVNKVGSMGEHVHFLARPFRLDHFMALLRQLIREPSSPGQ